MAWSCNAFSSDVNVHPSTMYLMVKELKITKPYKVTVEILFISYLDSVSTFSRPRFGFT